MVVAPTLLLIEVQTVSTIPQKYARLDATLYRIKKRLA